MAALANPPANSSPPISDWIIIHLNAILWCSASWRILLWQFCTTSQNFDSPSDSRNRFDYILLFPCRKLFRLPVYYFCFQGWVVNCFDQILQFPGAGYRCQCYYENIFLSLQYLSFYFVFQLLGLGIKLIWPNVFMAIVILPL